MHHTEYTVTLTILQDVKASLTILLPTPVLPAPPPPAVRIAEVEAPSAPVDFDHVTENTGKFTIGG